MAVTKNPLLERRDGVASATIGYFNRPNVKAGNTTPRTESYRVAGNKAWDKWTYLMIDPAEPRNVIPAANDASGKPLGKLVGPSVGPVAAFGLPVGCPVFVEYDINPEVVTFPADLDTWEKQKAWHDLYGPPGIILRQDAPVDPVSLA